MTSTRIDAVRTSSASSHRSATADSWTFGTRSVDGFPAVAAFIAGAPRQWSDLQIREDALLELCSAEGLSALCFHRFSQLPAKAGWPPRLLECLSDAARTEAGEELLRGVETRAVLEALTRAGIRPILIKGTPLAYTVYDAPALRPREDTDLLIASADVEMARRVIVVARVFGDCATAMMCFHNSKCRRSTRSVCAMFSTSIGRSAPRRSLTAS